MAILVAASISLVKPLLDVKGLIRHLVTWSETVGQDEINRLNAVLQFRCEIVMALENVEKKRLLWKGNTISF